MSDTKWTNVFQTICGHWPKFDPTPQFTDVFSKLPRQDLLMRSVQIHRAEPEGQHTAPSAARLRAIYDELAGANEAQTQAKIAARENAWRSKMPSIEELDRDRNAAKRAVLLATPDEIAAARRLLGPAASHWGDLPADLASMPSTRACILSAALDLLRGHRRAC